MDEREEARRRERAREKRRQQLRAKREAEVRKRLLIMGIAVLVLILCIVLGITLAVKHSKAKAAAAAAEKKKQEQIAREKEQEENTINFVAVGDNLIHLRLAESGMNDTGEWTYDHLYQDIKSDVEAADLSLITQETVFVEDRDNISGYPAFGSPPEFGNALANTGFDMVAHATNHVLDKGTDSIEYTMKWWKENQPDMEILGIHESQEDADSIKVVQCKALKIAVLDYTYGLNDIPVPEGKEYMIDVFDENTAREDIRKAKELADVVMVVMHVGEEYVMDVDEETRQWVDLFLEEDVDIVIGSHPHVVRTMETLTGEDGHKMLVYYSLGNLISTQNDLPSLLGAMAKITIRKNIETGKIEIPSHEFLPLITHYNHDTYTYGVYKLEDYTQELADQHTAYERNPNEFSIEYYQNLFEEIKSKGNDEGF